MRDWRSFLRLSGALASVFLLTGNAVYAAPLTQVAAPVDVPEWAFIGGGVTLIAWVLVQFINRSSRSATDAIVEIAKNGREALEMQRETILRLESKMDSRDGELKEQTDYIKMLRARVDSNEAVAMDQVKEHFDLRREEAAAKQALAHALETLKSSVDSAMVVGREDAKTRDDAYTSLVDRVLTAVTELKSSVDAIGRRVGTKDSEKDGIKTLQDMAVELLNAAGSLTGAAERILSALSKPAETPTETATVTETITVETIAPVAPAQEATHE